MGNRDKTWRATDEDGTKLEPWPKTLLPSKLPQCRIFTFGYDANVTDKKKILGKVSVKTLRDHGMELVSCIKHERSESGITGRPIVFVCHSLGGLVCKEASFPKLANSALLL